MAMVCVAKGGIVRCGGILGNLVRIGHGIARQSALNAAGVIITSGRFPLRMTGIAGKQKGPCGP